MTDPLRLQILSDLHRDVRPVEVVLSPEADVLVVAGDVCEGVERAMQYLRWATNGRVPVVFVAGNHEFYSHCIGEEVERGRALAADLGITFLENAEAIIGGVRFLGCTLWTNYEVEGIAWREQAMMAARGGMNDHRLIVHTKQPFQRFGPEHALARHRASRAWLEEALAAPFSGSTIVVTHHGPSRHSVHPKYAGDLINAAFASDLSDLVEASGAAVWAHGHTHCSFDYRLGSTRVICNPHGYGMENPEYNPALIVEVERP